MRCLLVSLSALLLKFPHRPTVELRNKQSRVWAGVPDNCTLLRWHLQQISLLHLRIYESEDVITYHQEPGRDSWTESMRIIDCSMVYRLFPSECRPTICICLEHTFTWTFCSTCPGRLSLFFTQLIWDKWHQLFPITQLPKTMKLNEDIRPRDIELEHSWRILVPVQQLRQLSSIQEVRGKESPSRHWDHCRPHTRS